MKIDKSKCVRFGDHLKQMPAAHQKAVKRGARMWLAKQHNLGKAKACLDDTLAKPAKRVMRPARRAKVLANA